MIRRLLCGISALGALVLCACEAPSAGDVDRRMIGSWTCVGVSRDGQPGAASYAEMLTTSDGRFSALNSVSSSQQPGALKLVGISSGTWASDGKTYTEHAQAFDLQYAEENGAPALQERLAELQEAANQTMLRSTPLNIDSITAGGFIVSDDEIQLVCARRTFPER